jgi:hypothetical protein
MRSARRWSEDGYYEEPTPYGPDPNIFTRALFEDGRRNRVLEGLDRDRRTGAYHPGDGRPGRAMAHALQKLMEHLPSENVTLTLIRDGDHRLSRDEDIARILAAVERDRQRHLIKPPKGRGLSRNRTSPLASDGCDANAAAGNHVRHDAAKTAIDSSGQPFLTLC